MIGILSKIFIKNRDDVSNPDVRQKYGVLCGFVGILLNILLFAGKCFAGAITGSIAVTADAFNNLSDAGSSVITLIGFKMAGQQADSSHPFGHGRIEYLAGFIVSIIILIMGFDLGKTSIEKIISPQPVQFSAISAVILAVSIAVKLYMSFYNRQVGKKIRSAAMFSTSVDSLSDSIATFGVLVAMLISHFANVNIDGWCGVVVSLFIFYSGFSAAKETISPLLGQPPDPEFVRGIEELVLSYDNVVGVHDLIVHDYGPGRLMISLHAEVPSDGDILQMHDTIDLIERQLASKYHCQAVIHMDPIATDDKLTGQTKAAVSDILAKIDPQITMHDFRMVVGVTHTNLIFDVVVPYGFRLSDSQLKAAIEKAIENMDGNFFAVITVDKSYI